MDSSLVPNDEDLAATLGLNLVYDEIERPSPQNTCNSKKKKPRKNNKYERRRAKARRAKEQQQQKQQSALIYEPASHNSNEATTPMEELPSSPEQCDQQVKEHEPSEENHDATGLDHGLERNATFSSHEPQEPTNATISSGGKTAPLGAVRAVALPPPSLPPSRKVHVDTRASSMEDRAKYYSEFHARPLEMDRKHQAVSIISKSRDSQHLFDSNSPVFERLGLHERLATAVASPNLGSLTRPTQIQTRVIAALHPQQQQQQESFNLFVQSETGSGKTLAYLLPVVQSLAVNPETGKALVVDRQEAGTRCIILCPTRELASQTALMASQLCQLSFSWLVPGCLSGGEKRKSEKARIRKGIAIVVTTPGRLLDHLTKTESLLMALKGRLKWLVLDEADRLLDMGLGSQVEQIVQHLRANQSKSGPKRNGVTWRSILVSATVTPKVEDLAKSMLGGDTWKWARGGHEDSPASDKQQEEHGHVAELGTVSEPAISVACDSRLDFGASTPRQLGQFHISVTAKLRLATLVAFLVQRVQKKERTVVFMSTCDGVDYHYALFRAMDSIVVADEGKDAAATGLFGSSCLLYKLHGNIQHTDRISILEKFNRGKSKTASILLATDVAARGLNLTAIDWTVQYDPPCEVADYAHRAGRTARAGKAGHSLLFLLPSEMSFLDMLKLKGLDSLTALSLASTLNQAAGICVDLTRDGEKHISGGGQSKTSGRSGESFSYELQRRLEECLLEDDARARESFKETTAKLGRQRKFGKRGKKEEPVGELLSLARRAYSSFIRSYPTKEKSVKHIFSARALHLGHMARSFALKEPPSSFANKARQLTADAIDEVGSKTRGSSLAFGKLTDQQIAESVLTGKRARLSSEKLDRRVHKKLDRSTDPMKARALLLANATSLERGGMDSF